MNYRLIAHMIGSLLMILGAFMLLPLLVALFDNGPDAAAFAWAAAITVSTGFLLRSRGPDGEPAIRDVFLITTLAWFLAGVLGAIPFFLAGTFDNVPDALFESISGFTTTGATVLEDIEGSPRGILLWRSLLQWLGGMGIIVLFVSLFPRLGVGGIQLFRTEVSSPMPEKPLPRVAQTAKLLYRIYVGLTALATLTLWASGLGLFDAVNHAMTSVATGGYSTRDGSVGAFNNPLAEGFIIVFMFLGGMNFVLQYRLFLLGDLRSIRDNSEFWTYAGLLAAASILITLDLWVEAYQSLGPAALHGTFQAVSIMTGTGYTTTDYGAWPHLATATLFLLMFIGGSAGSTSGGPKVLRILVMMKHALKEAVQLLHPRSVRPLWVGGQVIPEKIFFAVAGFLFLYGFVWFISVVILAGFGLDLTSAATAAIASLGTIGPGMGTVGPTETYAPLPAGAKLYLSFLMIAGRLELYGVLLLLSPAFWQRR